jgi:hypothetical protein
MPQRDFRFSPKVQSTDLFAEPSFTPVTRVVRRKVESGKEKRNFGRFHREKG